MKLGLIKLISMDDLSKVGGQLPKYVPAMLTPLNDFIQKIGQALQGQLTFQDNLLCRVVTSELTHATELEINPYASQQQRSLRVTGVLLLDSSGMGIDVFRWRRKENGNVLVTAQFDGGTTTTVADCTFVILLG